MITTFNIYRQEFEDLIKDLINDSLRGSIGDAPWRVTSPSEVVYKVNPANRCIYTIHIPKSSKDALSQEEIRCIDSLLNKIQERVISISQEGYKLWVSISFDYKDLSASEYVDIGWYTRSYSRDSALGPYVRTLIRKWYTIFPITEFYCIESVYVTSIRGVERYKKYTVNLQVSPMQETVENFRDLIEFITQVIQKEFTEASTFAITVTHSSPREFPITISISGVEVDAWECWIAQIDEEFKEFPRELIALGKEQYRYQL